MNLKLKTSIFASIFLIPVICFSQKADSCFRFIGISTGIGYSYYNFNSINNIIGADNGTILNSFQPAQHIFINFNLRNFTAQSGIIRTTEYTKSGANAASFRQDSRIICLGKHFSTKNNKYGISPQIGIGASNFEFQYQEKSNSSAFNSMLKNEKSVVLRSQNNYFVNGGVEVYRKIDNILKLGVKLNYQQYLMPVKWQTLNEVGVPDMPIKNLSSPALLFFVGIN